MAECRKRFNRLKRRIWELVVEEDAFGLKQPGPFKINQRFRFQTTPQQVDAFRQWLQQQMQAVILTVTAQQAEDAYWRQYIEEGYRKGAGRAWEDTQKVRQAMATQPEEFAFFQGGKEQFLRQSFAQPVAVEKVKLLAGRVFTELKGVTEQMGQRITRELTDGLVQGQSPRTIGRNLAKAVDVSRARADMIARTETIRAHAEGQLDSLEQLGVDDIGVAVEWSTSGAFVCPMCAPMEGVVLKLKEARGMIPRHPNCKCSFIPANVGESRTKDRTITVRKSPGKVEKRTIEEQKRSKTEVKRSIRESLKAEKRKGETIAERKRRSSWPGADEQIDKTRPKSPIRAQPRPGTKPAFEKRTDEMCGGLTANAPTDCSTAKSEIAKLNAKRVAREVQQYAEEHNERQFARSLGRSAKAMDDNEAIDIQWRRKGKTHGIELKTMVDNRNNKITMKQSAMQRKRKWLRQEKGRVFHTVVLDDGASIPGSSIVEKSEALKKFLSEGCCVDLKKRRILYRRGYGSFRVENMHEVKDIKELKRLMETPTRQLPKGAK